MKNSDRINTMREGWEVSIKANEECRIFLEALLDYNWLGQRKAQIQILLDDVKHAADFAEQYFRPEVINAESD